MFTIHIADALLYYTLVCCSFLTRNHHMQHMFRHIHETAKKSRELLLPVMAGFRTLQYYMCQCRDQNRLSVLEVELKRLLATWPSTHRISWLEIHQDGPSSYRDHYGTYAQLQTPRATFCQPRYSGTARRTSKPLMLTTAVLVRLPGWLAAGSLCSQCLLGSRICNDVCRDTLAVAYTAGH